ncbi:broad specificity phosphatase PhoE [Paenibacillus sacheonensis]|nr:broad specificity phosphatase PhoE [Paenibacillus sacheonensis]
MVSHGGLIGLSLQHLLPDRFATTYLGNASLTILNYSQSEWTCPLYNCTKHL